jgi:hypothetical protein
LLQAHLAAPWELLIGQDPVVAGGQPGKRPIPDAATDKPQRGEADGSGHAPHLAVLAFPQFDLEPARRDALPVTDGRMPRPEALGVFDAPGHTRQRSGAVDLYSRAQPPQGAFVGFSLHLDPIGLRQLLLRMADGMLEGAIVGQDQQAFTVGVEPARRIDLRNRNEVFQRRLAAFRAELAKNAVRFVEENDFQ